MSAAATRKPAVPTGLKANPFPTLESPHEAKAGAGIVRGEVCEVRQRKRRQGRGKGAEGAERVREEGVRREEGLCVVSLVAGAF